MSEKAERLLAMKAQGEKIAVLTAYDAPTAQSEHRAGVDFILVGDSVGTTVLGYASEREVTLADMAHHVAAVRRGAPDATVLADLPFATYDQPKAAVDNARILLEAGADIVKFEGAKPDIARALTAAGIAFCGHLGLECQHQDERRLKARTARDALQLEADALALSEAGASLIVLELIPEEVAARITRSIPVPTIGIGAGRYTDGQVLVITDVLGITGRGYRHTLRYADMTDLVADCTAAFVSAVRSATFPAREHVFHMSSAELDIMEHGVVSRDARPTR